MVLINVYLEKGEVLAVLYGDIKHNMMQTHCGGTGILKTLKMSRPLRDCAFKSHQWDCFGALAQLTRASDLHSEGREFESHTLHNKYP